MKRKVISTLFIVTMILLTITHADTYAEEMTEYEKYAMAVEYYNAGEYQSSFDLLEQIQNYSTSQPYYKECKRLLTPITMPNNDAYYKISSALYELGISHEIPLLTYQAEQITGLDLSDCEIDDLSFITSFINLEELYLDNNDIADLTPLKDLYELHTLSASNNEIIDVIPLYNLTDLTNLNLSDNNIEDIDYLANLTNLVELDLSSNNIEGIWVVKEMPNLNKLNLSNNNIKYLRALGNCKNLKELNLMYNEFQSVAALSTMTNLEVLEIGEYWFSYYDAPEDIEELMSRYTVQTEYQYRQKEIFIDDALNNLTNLRKLTLVNVGITSIDFLRNCIYLEALTLDESKIYEPEESLESIYNLNYLTYLSLNNIRCKANPYNVTAGIPMSNVGILENITKMTNLIHLNIGVNCFNDLSSIGNLINLTYLNISSTHSNFKDISFLSNLSKLTHLYIWDCRNIIDFSPLSSLYNIEYLDLHWDRLLYFKYIEQMHKLKYLNLNDAIFNSIDGIENMKGLEYLDIQTFYDSIEGKINEIERGKDPPFSSTQEKEDYINMYNYDTNLILNLSHLKSYSANEVSFDKPLNFKNLEYIKYINDADGIPANAIKEMKIGFDSSALQNNMEFISYFDNLERLDLTVSTIVDCTIEIPYLENIQVLNIGVHLEHWCDPESFPYLPTITIDLSSMEGQSKLEYINICYRGDTNNYKEKYIDIASLKGLGNCTNLRAIMINDANLSDISALENCSNLEIIDFSNCNIEDISALSDKHYLEELNLMKNNITDISALKNCYRMNRLRLSANPVTDADVIMEMPLVTDVWLDDTPYKRSSELSRYMKKMFTRWNH